ncbi:Ion transport 2 domain protein [Chryseobacterium phosphatilyticum]|uniref:Ion transport 2 domain protein n=1 Tax=Chryseobacterium phosphatilyticum TaxID=475075 RepID=A0A316XA09_9FLAO|nr:potassium channel family protein [Chryseobacterium phosphatilyticum]PWN70582.1 Ion transport 2 domain protein [Chryseobacterium phosphatilyticum]
MHNENPVQKHSFVKVIEKKLQERKYEILLFALLQHLFVGIFLTDMGFYTRIIWPINMLILGLGSIFLFTGKHSWRHWFRNLHFIVILLLPIGIPFFKDFTWYFAFLNINYVVFFCFLFMEVLRFLIKPGYINTDIISASICGYMLLIEISVFSLQFFQYHDSTSFKGVDLSSPALTFIDLVYFCSITFTSIGFGDITPNTHVTKLITAFVGIAGQFYTVVLVGILISKFSSKN